MSENDYLQQVMAKQQRVEVDLKARRSSPAPAAPAFGAPEAEEIGATAPRRASADRARDQVTYGGPSRAVLLGPDAPGAPAVDVRITGWGRWKTVIVPPNAHVVHTRRGHARPLHIGLGVSFRYNPAKDSFLVVPGTMQTIMINAYCICRELQGLLVQGYVQWIIADFATAYQKLDFTDVDDPMRVVNVSLREQAEAAIKDKVATMAIDDVLSDKQPIIEELTARLRSVAEGAGGSDTGLGLRIVTVQIKEAVVSSKRVWDSLQQPFRAERARVARLAALEAETAITARERATERDRQAAQLATEAELARLRAETEAQAFDRDAAEGARRLVREEETQRQTAQLRHDAALATATLDKVRVAAEAEVAELRTREAAAAARLDAEHQLALADLRRAAAHRQAEAELSLHEARARIANATSPAALQARLIEALPLIAERLPKPTELRAISIGPGGHGGGAELTSLIAQVLGVLDGFRGAVDREDARKLS